MNICRSCLAESREPIFVSLFSFGLQSKYTGLTSVLINSTDPVTTQICTQCMETLDLFGQYKARCIESNRILKDALCIGPIKSDAAVEEDCISTVEDIEVKQESENAIVQICQSKIVPNTRGHLKKSKSPSTGDETTRYKCPHCFRQYKKLGPAYQKHVQEHKTGINTKGVTIKPESFDKPTEQETSKREYKKINLSEHVVVTELGTTFYQCHQCPRQYMNQLAFKKHHVFHTYKKNLVCDECGRVLSTPNSLLIHKRHMHMKLRPFQCDTCSMAFKSKATMIEHIALKHIKDRKFLCDICSSSFKTEKSMKTHKKDVHFKSKTHKCSECEMTFKTRFVLATHFRNRHTKIRPFVCELCDRGFGLLNSLQKHMQTHKDGKVKIRNFKCEDCEKMFLSQKTLKDHQRLYHTATNPEALTVVVINEEEGCQM